MWIYRIFPTYSPLENINHHSINWIIDCPHSILSWILHILFLAIIIIPTGMLLFTPPPPFSFAYLENTRSFFPKYFYRGRYVDDIFYITPSLTLKTLIILTIITLDYILLINLRWIAHSISLMMSLSLKNIVIVWLLNCYRKTYFFWTRT